MNHLKNENSPYLQQHASNPVDWYPWGEEAFELARNEQKPVLVSIGYSTCHWCHVMEKESFEDPETAKLMNAHFINIKVDREERPDVDQLYMEAVQILGISGGWPLNCFITPSKKPFYGGTYFPPVAKYGRPSWKQLLTHIARLFAEEREVIEGQAEKLLDAIHRQNNAVKVANEEFELISGESSTTELHNIFDQLESVFDRQHGGFGSPPKFPGSMPLTYLLKYWDLTGKASALDHATFTILKMIRGGIFDQLGGGFARYATDARWLIPHFEKMLYDNALLINLMSDVFKITRSGEVKTAIEATIAFVKRELIDLDFGFFSALDADSEGEEGKFYVWQNAEIDKVLGTSSETFKTFYNSTDGGNWEGKNILHITEDRSSFAENRGIEEKELAELLALGRIKLLEERGKRVRPGLDYKKILSWNALMSTALLNAGIGLNNANYIQIANKNLDYLLNQHMDTDGVSLFRTAKTDKVIPAFLEDYAYFIQLLIASYQVNFDLEILSRADAITRFVLKNFLDNNQNLFYFTQRGQTDVPLRKIEVFDNAMPSGNAVMAENLLYLGILLGDESYRDQADRMLSLMVPQARRYPRSYGYWASVIIEHVKGVNEIAIVGTKARDFARELKRKFLPGSLIMANETTDERFPLLKNRGIDGQTTIYLCKNYSCKVPVTEIEDLLKQIKLKD